MATRVEANYVLTASDETARAFRSVENNLKGVREETARVGKAASLGFKLFVGGELLEGLRKLGGAMFDVKNATNAIDAGRIQKMRESTAAAGKAFAGVAATIGSMLAPVIERLSNWFVKAVGDGEVLRRFFHALFVGLVRGVGIFADAWRGMEIVWAGLKTLFWGFVGSMTDGLRQWDKVFVDVANKIPGVNLKYSEAIGQMAKESKANLEKNRQEMVDLLKKPLPSDAMLAAVAQMDKETFAYKAAADARVEIKKKEHEQIEEDMGAHLEERNRLMREHLLMSQQDEQDLNSLRQRDAAAYRAQDEAAEKAAADRKKNDRARTFSGTKDMLNNLSVLLNSSSRKAFEIGKASAIGETLMNTYASATGAYKSLVGIPVVGPALATAAAAAAVIAGMANVQSIRSQQFGGGGGGSPAVPSVTSTTSAAITPVQEAPTMPMSSQSGGPSRQVTLIVQSDSGMVSMDWVRNQLAPVMNEAAGDGVKFMVA